MNVVRGPFGPLPLEEAKKLYVQHWGVLIALDDDSAEFLISWDVIASLESAHTFSREDFIVMRKEAHVRTVAKKKR